RQDVLGHAEQAKEFQVPLAGVDVEQERARSIARIGDVLSDQIPEQPCVHRAESKLTGLGFAARARDMIEPAGQIGAGEIRVEQQPGALLNHPVAAFGAESITLARRAPVLPDDGLVTRMARLPIQNNGVFTLVGNADRRNITRAQPRLLERSQGNTQLRRQDFMRVVFDPARLGVELVDLLLCYRADGAGVIKHDCARAGGSFVESKNVGHGSVRCWIGRLERFESVGQQTLWVRLGKFRPSAPWDEASEEVPTSKLKAQKKRQIPIPNSQRQLAARRSRSGRLEL